MTNIKGLSNLFLLQSPCCTGITVLVAPPSVQWSNYTAGRSTQNLNPLLLILRYSNKRPNLFVMMQKSTDIVFIACTDTYGLSKKFGACFPR